jgi:nitrite reductase/ring-hydroxylating ferredoxin subunit
VVGTSNGFGCPCHGGNYDSEGKRIAGPPIRPLNRFEYKVEEGNLYIGRAFATKEEDGRVVVTDEWKDPGQPTSGLLSILYPAPPR